MSINSCRKGKDGELEWAAFLREHGIQARRGRQYQGGPESPDVVSELDWVHWEVKLTERLRIYSAMEKAEDDTKADTRCTVPIVAHRANRKRWVCVLWAEDLVELLKVNEKRMVEQ